jgi:ornithine cyclodeaminase/alanine dehydrogenase-like protein (mu-crystallin family)
MTGAVLRLSAEEVLRALEDVDPLAVVAEELTGGAHPDEPPTCRFLTEPGRPPNRPHEQTAVQDLATGDVCLFPTSSLRLVRAAALAGLAAREVHVDGVVTAALFASAAATPLHLAVIARHVPWLTHISVHTADAASPVPIGRALLDQLESAGIGVSATADMRHAAAGANLLITADFAADRLAVGLPPLGSLTVNATGVDLPADLLGSVDQVYVDDLALLAANRHRTVAAMHLAEPGAHEELAPRTEGWYRPHAAWRHRRRIDADLAQVLTGQHAGRTDPDDILLVELLGLGTENAALGGRLQRAALERGLGVRLADRPRTSR